MPTYEYECEKCGHNFDEFQRMADAPLVKCPKCKKLALKRIFSPVRGIVKTVKTVGSLAEQNAKSMSSEQKAKLTEEAKTKKDQCLYDVLPTGMSRMDAPKEKPWYKTGQSVSEKKLNKMNNTQKNKYVLTGNT